MNIVRFQGEAPSVYYEFDKDSAPLGEGGMGRIYQGFRNDTAYNYQSVVAIKCIKPELSGNATIIQRAQREASVQIDHDNLIRMYGFMSGAEINSFTGGYTPTYYIAMERLLGVNLDEVLFKGIVTDKSGITVPMAQDLYNLYSNNREKASVEILISVLNGVQTLHNFGYLHRDLDPSNVMITQDGKIKVIDFGISKRLDGSSSGAGLTQAGQFLGKVAYAAPELILGDLNNQGPATDLYALGIMLYQMVTGFLPVEGSDQEVMDAHLKGKFDFSVIENKNLRQVIIKATQKNPADRFYSASDFIDALQNIGYASSKKKQKYNSSIQSSSSIPSWSYAVSAVVGLGLGVLVNTLI